MNTNKDSHFLSTVWFPSRKCTTPDDPFYPYMMSALCLVPVTSYRPPPPTPAFTRGFFRQHGAETGGWFFSGGPEPLVMAEKNGVFFLFIRHGMWRKIWLVVEPTHLKNMLVKLGSSSPSFGVKIKHIWNHHLEIIILWMEENPAPADTVNIPLSSIIYKVLYNPAGAGFLSSRVWHAGTSIFPENGWFLLIPMGFRELLLRQICQKTCSPTFHVLKLSHVGGWIHLISPWRVTG